MRGLWFGELTSLFSRRLNSMRSQRTQDRVDLSRRFFSVAPLAAVTAETILPSHSSLSRTSAALASEGSSSQSIPAGTVLDWSGKDLELSDVSFISENEGGKIVVGGREDPSFSLELVDDSLKAGARSFTYKSFTGSLAPDDWLYISGHLEGAWTTNGGRVCEVGYLCRIRDIDLENRTIFLFHYIPETIDSDVVDDGAGNSKNIKVSVGKAYPRRVKLSGIGLERVSLDTRYVIDSSIEARLSDAISPGFSVSVLAANNLRVKVDAVSRPTSAGAHPLVLQNIYGGVVDFKASAVNYSNAIKNENMIAKAFRGSGLIHCDIRSHVIGAALWANTVHCMIGGRFTGSCADPGGFNTDNNVLKNNRNDANNFVYMRRGAQIDITAVEFDSTGLEVFGARDSEIIGCRISKTRSNNPNPDCGMLSIKGITRNLVVRGFTQYSRGDPNQAIRLEFQDLHRGLYQQGITFIDAVVDTDGNGIMTRGMPVVRATSLTCSNGVVVAVAADHNLATGMEVRISGFNEPEFNGDFQVSVTDEDHFTFRVSDTAASLPSGPGTISLIMDADVKIIGGHIKSPRPLYADRNVRDITLNGTTVQIAFESPTSYSVAPSHAIILLGGHSSLKDVAVFGTDRSSRRALSCEHLGSVVDNVRSDGGVYYQSTKYGHFDPEKIRNTNMDIQFEGSPLLLRSERDGNFSVDGALEDRLLALDVTNWPEDFFLRKKGGKTPAEGWVLKGKKWIAVS